MLGQYKNILNQKGKLHLKVKISPNAKQSEFAGLAKQEDGEIIKIRIKALPEKGQANTELIRFLAKEFDVPAGNVKIVTGSQSRIKLIKISA